MNEISPEIQTGTIGELLVQLRLLQFGVQAAPPLTDSGNDLIAVRGKVFRAIQVKTTKRSTYSKDRLPDHYHILAVVQLFGDRSDIFLDQSRIFLIPKRDVKGLSLNCDKIIDYLFSKRLVEELFSDVASGK
jgi:hypothetical protein